jgi:hypothetical protein
MNIKVVKKLESSEETISDLYINDIWFCHVLEDQHRQTKVKGDTRIPAGTYTVKLRKAGGFYSKYLKNWPSWLKKFAINTNQKFIGSLHITNVPGFEYILIHVGNTEKDTAGCLLVGNGYIESNGRYSIKDSTKTFIKFYDIVADELEKGNDVKITIIR